MPDTPPLAPPPAPPQRALTLDDVHRLVGSLYLEIQMLQRENAQLRARARRGRDRLAGG